MSKPIGFIYPMTPFREHVEARRRRGLLARRLARLVIEQRELARDAECATTRVYESKCRTSLIAVEQDIADLRTTMNSL